MNKCNLCPRSCNVDRNKSVGFCKLNNKPKLALVKVHHGEEPIISGTKGSGTIFFSGCNLKCVFCQNYQLSHDNYGEEISVERLVEIFKELEEKGVHNINLVSPTSHADLIVQALEKYTPKIPIVYNSNGYEKTETLQKLSRFIDIYLVDYKYFDDNLGRKYSKVDNYRQTVIEAITQMKQNQPTDIFDENGIMQKGVIIRHLVLPSHSSDSVKVLESIAESFGNDVIISVMSQYYPCYKAHEFSEINRGITALEYKRVLATVERLGFVNGFVQDLASATKEETPIFDLSGVLRK